MTNTDIEALVQRLAELEQRVQRTEDVESIKQMHRRYIRKLADRDWDGMADFFTEDAVTDIRWHGRTEGKQALVDDVFNDLHNTVTSADGYILSSPVIEVAADGTTAFGEWTWHRHICEFRMSGGFMRAWGPWLEGRYKCSYAKVDGVWLFENMWFRVVLPDLDPEADEMASRIAEGRHVIGGGIASRS